MILLIVSFIAGVLTVLAPCILPVLPVVIGSSASGRNKATPYVVVISLALSIIVFTYILKASTALIMIPPYVWTYLSGGILTIFGLILVFPFLWEKMPLIAKIAGSSNKFAGAGYQKKNFWGDVIVGSALGPIFSTCSPTYFVILASVLPASFLLGTIYLFSYTLGLSLILLLIALLGQRFANKLNAFSDSKGWFKKIIGVIFILLGIAIASGYEKKLEVKLLDSGFFDITKIEQLLLKNVPSSDDNLNQFYQKGNFKPYKEIVNPSGFINTDKITIKENIGKKVILVDFMTYSCINCQRTFPYLVSWYEKYKDQGLEIIGIHTPEFAFEKDINNVKNAMKQFGITYPVVLDNDYATWREYGNNYWPRKYLIDINGNIVYDHIGEGAYEETEKKIQELLQERKTVLGLDQKIKDDIFTPENIVNVNNFGPQSPEIYFGALRNNQLGNGKISTTGIQNFSLPQNIEKNTLYFEGKWDIQKEFALNQNSLAKIIFKYQGKNVYFVAGTETETKIKIFKDGVFVEEQKIKEHKLYQLIEDSENGEHTLEIIIETPNLQVFTFTFG